MIPWIVSAAPSSYSPRMVHRSATTAAGWRWRVRENREHNGEEIIIERPDGSRAAALAHANPMHDEAGNIIGAVNVLVDITDRKRDAESQVLLKNELADQLGDLRRLHEMSVQPLDNAGVAAHPRRDTAHGDLARRRGHGPVVAVQSRAERTRRRRERWF